MKNQVINQKHTMKNKKEVAKKMGAKYHPGVSNKFKADQEKSEKYWTGMSKKLRVGVLKKTGSHQDDYGKSIGAMGGSQADAVGSFVHGKRKEAYLKRIKK